MFKLNESKSFVLISKNIPARVINFEDGIFLESFLSWSRQYLLEKKQQTAFQNNILRHCGPNSTYTGRQNILEQLAAIYQFVKTINPLETDLLRSIVSRIEERALHCTPGFETGICDLAQDLLYTPQSLDELLQNVRQDIVKKTAIGMTSDVHGHNQVFSFAAAHYAVRLLNPGDPYLGELNHQLVEKTLAKRFDMFYHSVNLIAELNEQFFLVLQSLGYAEYKIEPETHTKIKNFILTIFTHHPLVKQLQQAEVYLKAKEDIKQSALNQVAQLLNQRRLFDLPKEEQNSRLRDLQNAEVPEWLPQSLHEEFIELSKIEAQSFKQAALIQFIENHRLFQIEDYHQNLKTRAASGISKFIQPSIKQWLNTLMPEIHAEIKAIYQHSEAQMAVLEPPLCSLDEASNALDECFWVSEESNDFPYQQLKMNEIRKAFFNELKQRGYIQDCHPLIERVIGSNNSSQIQYDLRLLMSEVSLDIESSMLNLFTLIQVQSAYLDSDFFDYLYHILIDRIQHTEVRQVKKLISLLMAFKIELPFQILTYSSVVDILEEGHLPQMLRCLKEKSRQLDFVACFYAKPGFHPQPEYLQAALSSLLTEYKLAFIERYGAAFIHDSHRLIETMKQLPRESRYQVVEFMHTSILIEANAYQALLDLLPSQDRIPFCQLMQRSSPGNFNHTGFNKMIMEKLDINQRFLFLTKILDSNHPEFHDFVVKTFSLWSKQDRLSFLRDSEFFIKMNIHDFSKILFRGRFSEEEILNFLDVYLDKQTRSIDGYFMGGLCDLLEKLSLPVGFVLERYLSFAIKSSYSDHFYRFWFKKLAEEERFKFLMEMPQDLKQIIIQKKLVFTMMDMLALKHKYAYLRHFGLALTQLAAKEEDVKAILKATPIDERQQVLQELKPCLGPLITSGYGFTHLLTFLRHSDYLEGAKILIHEFGVGEHITKFLLNAIAELPEEYFEPLIATFGSKMLNMIDNQELNDVFAGFTFMTRHQAKIIGFLQNHHAVIKPKKIQELALALQKIRVENRDAFVKFILDHWRIHPVSFSDFFEFLSCKGLTAKHHFLKLIAREHFSGDEQNLSFPDFIEKICVKLDPKFATQVLSKFSGDLGGLIRNPEALQQILKNVALKDQLMLINQLGCHFPAWFNSLDAIEQTLTLLRHPQSCLSFMQLQGPGLIGLLQENVLKTCNLVGFLPVEKQLFFLSQCRFSTAHLSAIQSQSVSSPLIRIYVDLTIKEMGLSGHGFFDASYSSLIQKIKGILIQPKAYTIEVIRDTIKALSPALRQQIDTPFIMTYLLERESEPSAKKSKK